MLYSHGVAQFADLFSPTPEEPSRFLSSLVEPGSRILDVGAGVGGTAFALAAAGHEVTALEPDPEMFAVLLSRLAQRPELQARLSPVPAAAGFDFGPVFDLVFSFAVVHLLEAADRLDLARYAAAQVRPEARVVLEIPVAAATRAASARELSGRCSLGEIVVEKYTTMEPAENGWWHTRWEFSIARKGQSVYTVGRTFRWYPCTPAEAFALLERAGLRVADAFGGFERERFVEGESRSLVAVAHVIPGGSA